MCTNHCISGRIQQQLVGLASRNGGEFIGYNFEPDITTDVPSNCLMVRWGPNLNRTWTAPNPRVGSGFKKISPNRTRPDRGNTTNTKQVVSTSIHRIPSESTSKSREMTTWFVDLKLVDSEFGSSSEFKQPGGSGAHSPHAKIPARHLPSPSAKLNPSGASGEIWHHLIRLVDMAKNVLTEIPLFQAVEWFSMVPHIESHPIGTGARCLEVARSHGVLKNDKSERTWYGRSAFDQQLRHC
ncbi:hypothetical protein FB45DRAFT_872880 [Roridomyces roridus]|uniref:Uncharacterized protein n=1 Tax=Roridomyces roridus TaxID=1738132 RepID=A0AAD7BBY2_9AGAR|nr:hypothetical protein FB45DRAFT_872880 [Roridomyces roridus]